MKHDVVIIVALIMMALMVGCTSQAPTPSAITTRAPGPGITRTAETSPAPTVPAGQVLTAPDNVTRVTTTYHDIFFLEPVKDYHVGDNITVQGTTILAAGDPLLVEVVSSSFGPAPKSSGQSFTGISGIVTVHEGPPGGPNSWSFSFPTDGFITDTYIVTVSGITVNVIDSTTFQLKP